LAGCDGWAVTKITECSFQDDFGDHRAHPENQNHSSNRVLCSGNFTVSDTMLFGILLDHTTPEC